MKGLLIGHFLLTIGAITVTGQHRFIDLAGSAVELAIAYFFAILVERALDRRRSRRQPVVVTGA